MPDTGSYEVRFADGRASKFYYYDDVLRRRLRPEILTSEQALEQAKALARAERDKPTNCSSRPPGAGNHRFLSVAGSIS